jgi:hypothetical protein
MAWGCISPGHEAPGGQGRWRERDSKHNGSRCAPTTSCRCIGLHLALVSRAVNLTFCGRFELLTHFKFNRFNTIIIVLKRGERKVVIEEDQCVVSTRVILTRCFVYLPISCVVLLVNSFNWF